MFHRIFKQLTGRPFSFALALFCFVLFLSGLFINHEFSRIRENIKHEAFVNLLTLGARLEGEINSHLVVLRGLKAEIAINSDITQSEFESLAQEYLQSQLSISHLGLAPDLVITNIYPLQGNERALGLDYRTVPQQMAVIQEAIDKNEIIIAGPVKLVQGNTALVVRVPVFIGENRDQLWGVITGVIRDQMLFEQAGIAENLWGLNIAIRGHNGLGEEGDVFYGSEKTFTADAVMVDVILPSGRWQIAASSNNGWQVDQSHYFSYWFVAILVSLVIAMASYLISTNYREKLIAIETANYRANYDGLTNLSNRYHFTQQLKATIHEHQRHQHKFALFFIDLDYFKEVNDNWGHHAGDELLRLFADRMSSIVRSDDLLARLAGDEFVIVLKDIETATQAELLAEKLQMELGEPYPIQGRHLSVTHSLGIAIFPEDGQDLEALLQNADRAMYEAKRAGKNRIFFFNEQLSQEVKRHVQVHNEILDGLRHGEFELYFQPIMDLEQQSISKCEALVRWNHPKKGLVSPIEFIPIAEHTGAICNLGDWILEETCHLLNKMAEKGVDVQVSINRSVAEFQGRNVDQRWLNTLKKYHIDTSRVVFEITESLLMGGVESQLEKINTLRASGIAFSIDDFGTGYSAINYLRHYPVDYLKIDRSFVKDVMDDEQDRTLVEVIIKMGQTLGIKVVAEGVEDQAQLDLLSSYGCDFIQGYHLGKPMPFDQFLSFCLVYSPLETA
ncbi:EAL domain-containing protein [Neptuniibacter sp.]|uniref:putative bifunctional diguanylate cyclase/phosphodiesterase n=1 Tax=Neptuniibacter sp. TaxID=1962643 RepID=UPI0026016213|nr:EAL domain-containing protein [Neptuniibacter sp.]MCP4596668.1 bifunctional diguanylate cyclase/phosphodiesterase [Neptuniibacter sp.]